MVQQTGSLADLFVEIDANDKQTEIFNTLRDAVKKNPNIIVKEFLEQQDEEKLHHRLTSVSKKSK